MSIQTLRTYSHVKGNGVLQKLYVSIQNLIFQMQKNLRKSAHCQDLERYEIYISESTYMVRIIRKKFQYVIYEEPKK